MTAVLLTSAAVLGLLSFFEPCTIATHTLFAARSSQAIRRQRLRDLVQLIFCRTFLLTLIFIVAAKIGLAPLTPALAATLLFAVGMIYLATLKLYLPVPHLEFYRLIPGSNHGSQAFKLGFTLPACTLPLAAIVGVLAALNQELIPALLAGVMFAAMFTLPTLWYSIRGVNNKSRKWLSKSAHFSHYATTLLLWSSAFMVWHGEF